MPTQQLQGLGLLDWAIIAAFFAATLGIGLYFSRRAKASLADYFVAGRKIHWWVAGTSIVATSFAADTPLVISGWSRTIGLERNWFWWGGIMGMMLCTFFFARLWRRAKLLTDVEFVELRYAGAPAAGLRIFHASYRSLIQNTLVMGWVTLAMVKILEVTLDIPSLVFVSGQLMPELVPKGVEITSQIDPASILTIPGYGDAIISAKATGIIVCFTVAAGYSAVSGLWGVMATDVFQFCLAMTGTVILMAVVFAVANGPTQLVHNAIASVNSGEVINNQPTNRQILTAQQLADINADPEPLIASGLISPVDGNADEYIWTASDLDTQAIRNKLPDETTTDKTLELWQNAYTIGREHFKEAGVADQLVAAGLLREDLSDDNKKLGYYRIPDLSLTEEQLLAKLDAAGIEHKSEMMSAWRNDTVVAPSKITGFLPPFDIKNGGLTAIWALIVFLGLQWWAGGEGGGFLAQRLFSCKDEKHSLLAMLWYNFAMFVLRPWPWIVVGVGSLFLIPDVTAYGEHYTAEHAYVIMLMKYLPAGLKGLMVAALMAAYMSTISTHVNFGASYVVNDLYKRFVSPNGSEKSYVLVSKLSTIVLAVLAGVYAYYSESIATGWYTFFELMSGAGFAVLLRWYWWRISAWSEIAAMASSLIVFSLLNYTQLFQGLFDALGLGAYNYLLDEYAVRFTLNVVISTAIWVSVTFIMPPEKDEHLVKFYQRVQPPGGWKRIAHLAGHSDHLQVGLLEWTGWFLGCTGLFAMIFSLGHACFGNYTQSAAFGLYGLIATVLIFKLLTKMDWSAITEEK